MNNLDCNFLLSFVGCVSYCFCSCIGFFGALQRESLDLGVVSARNHMCQPTDLDIGGVCNNFNNLARVGSSYIDRHRHRFKTLENMEPKSLISENMEPEIPRLLLFSGPLGVCRTRSRDHAREGATW